MLNRSQRRKLSKDAKKKLTDKQFKEYMDKAQYETVKLEVDAEVKRVLGQVMDDIIVSMREHRISEERIEKIVKRTLEIGDQRRNEKRIS